MSLCVQMTPPDNNVTVCPDVEVTPPDKNVTVCPDVEVTPPENNVTVCPDDAPWYQCHCVSR